MDDKRHVLIVEDDTLLQGLLSEWLVKSGIEPHAVPSGEQAFDLLHKNEIHPDLIILDIMLPGMNGFDVLQTLKMDERTKNIPVLILSNLGQESDIAKGKQLGAENYVVKVSLTLDEVVHVVNDMLTRSKSATA